MRHHDRHAPVSHVVDPRGKSYVILPAKSRGRIMGEVSGGGYGGIRRIAIHEIGSSISGLLQGAVMCPVYHSGHFEKLSAELRIGERGRKAGFTLGNSDQTCSANQNEDKPGSRSAGGFMGPDHNSGTPSQNAH